MEQKTNIAQQKIPLGRELGFAFLWTPVIWGLYFGLFWAARAILGPVLDWADSPRQLSFWNAIHLMVGMAIFVTNIWWGLAAIAKLSPGWAGTPGFLPVMVVFGVGIGALSQTGSAFWVPIVLYLLVLLFRWSFYLYRFRR